MRQEAKGNEDIQAQTKQTHICGCNNYNKYRLGTFPYSYSFISADLKDKYAQLPRHSRNIKGAEPLGATPWLLPTASICRLANCIQGFGRLSNQQ